MSFKSVRAAFEAWAVDQPWLEDDEGRVNLRYLGLHHQYVDMTVEHASRAFEAGRQQGIEQALAEVVDATQKRSKPLQDKAINLAIIDLFGHVTKAEHKRLDNFARMIERLVDDKRDGV